MLQLVTPSEIEEQEFLAFVNEFRSIGERYIPYAINPEGQEFATYVATRNEEAQGINLREGWVPASTFFLINSEGRILGAINIRHELNDFLRTKGGHIGYGVRPSERNKGYASQMLALALKNARDLALEKVLITCDKDNPSSAKVITNNGGVLDSEFLDDEEGILIQRYWVDVD